ncbi:NAD-dependent protein deacetylase sirtuin-2 [Linnemannia hyalina]|uniref:NAD-dependent protein deacetylase n=1 Tax=Linnemannia hyalina TaxID=64524 RepID=A0A9P7Y0P9_9FUNG|nr:NAD-dependent protein deacetylase sirtuin-2 [Linnemannia hyalina]
MAAPRVVNARATRSKGESATRTRILKDGTIESVAELINNGSAKNIIVMSGAGISTAAGIKDFRSPGTGLYDDLERFNLPYPEAVFDISFFKDNPDPFYRLAKELLPGRYRPTFTHYLLPLLAKKDLLLRSYTQNIDMLERLTGLDEDLLVEAHGSFATSECIQCNELCDNSYVRKHILKGEIPHCMECKGLVKPTITFFGEQLPDRFGTLAQVDFKKCDLLIVLGTSLQVEPFNRLITRVPASCPRLLINREKAGEDMHLGFDFDDKWKYPVLRDAVFLGNCDEGVRQLAKLCGWEGELQAMFEAGNIEMALAEELEALTLAKEAEEEQKEIEERAKAEQESDKGEKEKPHVKEHTENVLKDTHENHQVPKNLEESKSNTKKPSSSDDVDAISDLLQATEISSSKKDSAPAKDTTKAGKDDKPS